MGSVITLAGSSRCGRCGGFVRETVDLWGRMMSCYNCGHYRDLPDLPDNRPYEPEYQRPSSKPRLVARGPYRSRPK